MHRAKCLHLILYGARSKRMSYVFDVLPFFFPFSHLHFCERSRTILYSIEHDARHRRRRRRSDRAGVTYKLLNRRT